ncbi:porin family protein [Myxococcota bacterium]|nr:porin family protein [Myxococcota bacterium]MBU1898312.1 porin family protein [Myxococcota bacterium]
MRTALFILLLGALPASAWADSDSLITLGLGAQVGMSTASDNPELSGQTYGALARFKLLRVLGVEALTQLDQDPKSQRGRLLSPRYQLGAMLNLVPTQRFNLFGVAGVGAHEAPDLKNLDGLTTSFYMGPGLEIFVGEHLAFGADLRFRLAGPRWIKEEIRDELSPEPLNEALTLQAWQVNLSLSYYL